MLVLDVLDVLVLLLLIVDEYTFDTLVGWVARLLQPLRAGLSKVCPWHFYPILMTLRFR